MVWLRGIRTSARWRAAWAASAIAAFCGCTNGGDAAAGNPTTDAGSQETAGSNTQISYSVESGRTILQWPEDEWPFHCIRFTQQVAGQAKPVEVSLCNKQEGRTKIVLGDTPGKDGVDFAWSAVQDLELGKATWALQGGEKNWGVTPNPVGKGSLNLGPHFGGPCQTTTTVATGLDEWQFKAPATLNVSVKLGEAARSTVDIIRPDIWVDSVNATGNPAKGGTIAFKYTFALPGMYTVEVNNTGGGAILNCGVYVAAELPIIPVEVGGGAGLTGPPSETQLASLRQKLLTLTNAERARVQLGPLALDDTLNKMAQYHSEDMGSKGYFAHDAPNGESLGDRAKMFKWSKGVGENIASNLSPEGAHNGLFWSAGHRKNILGKSYKFVGFGIAKAGSGNNMLVTENFGD